jgi:probable DNA repair protein
LHEVIDAARQGALVLSSNKRLMRHIHQAFDQQMLAQNLRVWPTPQIFSFDGWLSRQVALLDCSATELSPVAARRVWEQIIEQDEGGGSKKLLQLGATADKAAEAAALLTDYNARLADWPLTEDQQMFAQWLSRYQTLCRENVWCDRAMLRQQVAVALNDGRLLCPESLVLTGFDQPTPLLDYLCHQVKARGGRVATFTPTRSACSQQLMCSAYVDPVEEVQAAARWARHLLCQKSCSIGIVVVDLHQRRSLLEQVFRQQLEPASCLNLNLTPQRYSLSLGTSLSEQGPIHAALELLRLNHSCELEQISFLLRSPFLKGSQSEAEARAQFDVRLRGLRRQTFSLPGLLQLAQRDEQGLAQFIHILQRVQQQLNLRQQSPAAWALSFSQLMQQAGWPGEGPISSRVYQMLMAWHEKLLPALAGLDLVCGEIDRATALSLLHRIGQDTEFQLEAPTGQVQILGLLEAAGLEFDHLWVMGVNEDLLPAVINPNPFIPVALQVKLQMPRASSARELEFSRQVMQRLCNASDHIVFSYARRRGDCDLRPSPLLAGIPEGQPILSESGDPFSLLLSLRADLRRQVDDRAPQLAASFCRGGTGILKDQALCPFRAFAHHRLGAQAFERPSVGLDALARGNLTHKTLEDFWRRVKTRQQLSSLTQAQYRLLMEQVISQVLQDFFSRRPDLPDCLAQIESERLQNLMQEWLVEVELKRRDFTVEHLETRHLEQVGPLQIHTVIDRMDRLEDGRLVILDYKTGVTDIKKLLGEDLLEPQLPIYAIAEQSGQLAAVAFAQVRISNCRLNGLASQNELLPNLKDLAAIKQAAEQGLSAWSDLLNRWRDQLEQLAGAFFHGDARVMPIAPKFSCDTCDLMGLCRVVETISAPGDDE